MLGQIDFVGALVQCLNYTILLGALVVKAPQIVKIVRSGDTLGISESACLLDWIASTISCYYNILRGFPFSTWGEMMFVGTQTTIIILLYWRYTPAANSKIRYCGFVGYFVCSGALLWFGAPDWFLPVLGLMPTVIATMGRLPQIVQNFSQGHTGQLAFETFFLQLGGSAARLITTLQLLDDKISLLGYFAAALTNAMVVLQILRYREATAKAMSKAEGRKHQPHFPEDTTDEPTVPQESNKWPVKRVKQQCLKSRKRTRVKQRSRALLVMNGSFNPPHAMHVKSFDVARQFLESLGVEVVAGFIVPSSDSYVRGKLGSDAMKLHDRVQCCELATASHSWIQTSDLGWANMPRLTEELQKRYRKSNPGSDDVVGYQLCGADYAAKISAWRRVHRQPLVVLGRPPDTDTVRTGLHGLHNQCQGTVHLVHQPLQDLSSTMVRKLLKEKRWNELSSDEGIPLHPDVVDYLRENVAPILWP